MRKRLSVALLALALTTFAAACGGDTANTNVTYNANATASANANAGAAGEVRTAPDNSEIRTETAGGVTTETRTFSDPDSRVSKVVVTTRDGRRTARVYYRDNTARELPESDVERALDATGDALVRAGGKVVDVSKEVGSEIGDKAEDVGDKAVDVGKEIGDKAEDVGDQTVKGAKKAGSATVKGAKKVGGAVKDAVTP